MRTHRQHAMVSRGRGSMVRGRKIHSVSPLAHRAPIQHATQRLSVADSWGVPTRLQWSMLAPCCGVLAVLAQC